MDGTKPICFYRESIINFSRHRPQLSSKDKPPEVGEYKWYSFEPDLAIKEVTSVMFAGMFSMRLYIHDIEADGPFDPTSVTEWTQKPPMRLNAYRCRAAIY